MSNNPDNFVLSLSQDEVAFILRATGYERLPNFTIPDDYSEIHAEVALRTLISRGIATLEGNPEPNLTLDAPSVGLVLSGAACDRMMSISVLAPTAIPQIHWFYHTPEITVHHLFLVVGVHIFRLMNAESLTATLAAFWESARDVENPSSFHLPRQTYTQARQAAQNGHLDQAYADLAAHLPADLAALLVQPRYSTMVTATQLGEEAVTGFAVFEGESGFWKVDLNGSSAHITLVDMPSILEAAVDLFIGNHP